jgi:hypothetical protein
MVPAFRNVHGAQARGLCVSGTRICRSRTVALDERYQDGLRECQFRRPKPRRVQHGWQQLARVVVSLHGSGALYVRPRPCSADPSQADD